MRCLECNIKITKKNQVRNGPYKYNKCRKCINKIVRAFNKKRKETLKKDKWFK